MKIRRTRLSLVVGLLAVFGMGSALGSSGPGPGPGTGAPLSVVDDLGRTLTLEAAPRRIVAAIPSAVEILFDLGLAPSIVGVSSLTETLAYVPEIQAQAELLPKVGDYTLNYEVIVSLEPDLVVIDRAQQKDLPQLERLGLPVYVTGATDIDGVMEDVLELGQITGALERAQAIVGEMHFKRMKLVQAVARLPSSERLRVFLEIFNEPLFTAGGGTLLNHLLELAGGRNVFADLAGFPQVSAEEVVARDPQVIIVTAGFGETLETLRARPGLSQLPAVRNGNVIFLSEADTSLVEQPGTKVVEGALRLFELLYGISLQDELRELE